jgi:hypothetical protein
VSDSLNLTASLGEAGRLFIPHVTKSEFGQT